MASVAKNVPVLVCGGMAKKYLIPGWRLGWILIHDPIGAFDREVYVFNWSYTIMLFCFVHHDV